MMASLSGGLLWMRTGFLYLKYNPCYSPIEYQIIQIINLINMLHLLILRLAFLAHDQNNTKPNYSVQIPKPILIMAKT